MFHKFIGQENNKYLLNKFITAAKEKNETLDHVLLEGNAGLGKTMLANLIHANIGGQQMITINGCSLRDNRTINGLFIKATTNNAVIFIDEVHRINPKMYEALYEPMDNFRTNMTKTMKYSAAIIYVHFKKFTLVAATTHGGALPAAFRSRFGISLSMTPYTNGDLAEIILQYAPDIGMTLSTQVAKCIAARSRNTPRVAKHLLKRIRDLAGNNPSVDQVVGAMDRLGVAENGLNAVDIAYLKILSNKRVKSLRTISAGLNYEAKALMEIIEPFLMNNQFIEVSHQGRKITELGCLALHLHKPTQLHPSSVDSCLQSVDSVTLLSNNQVC